ncbi:MAG: hypothetical protein HY582_05715, partial [Candidatus Omnitrophica bacterium]|nr:hypothetical protein [Candidatus Omnitrophota bacterium]
MLGGQISLKVLIPPYVGLFAIAFLMVSLSLLLSSLTASHSVAVILGFFAAVLFWMFGWVVLWIAPGMYSVMKGFWVVEHMREYAKGVLDTGPTIFYFAWTVFFLFVTSLTLESRNWKR